MPYDCVSNNYCYVDVEQCREPMPAEMVEAIAHSQEDIQKILDEQVHTAADLEKLPEPLKPYAYKYLWDRLSTDGGLVNNAIRFLTNQPDPVADILKIEPHEISASTEESWLMTSGGWVYVPPFGVDILYPALFNVWQSASSSNARAAAAFMLGVFDGVYENFPIDESEFYKWTWENGTGLASQEFNHARIRARIEYCKIQLKSGTDVTAMLGEIEKAMPSDAPAYLRAQFDFLMAVNFLNLGRRNEAASSAMVAWEEGGVIDAQRLLYMIQITDKKLDVDMIAYAVDLNVADIRRCYERINNGDTKAADSLDPLASDTGLLAEMALYATFMEGAPDENKLKKLHDIWKKAARALDENTFTNLAGLLEDAITGKSSHVSNYPAVAELHANTWKVVWPNLTHAMRTNNDVLAFFVAHTPQDKTVDIASAYWRLGYESSVTEDNFDECYGYSDISTRIFTMAGIKVVEFKLKDDTIKYELEPCTAEEALQAGTAWSMYAEFLVDHEAKLIERGMFDDEKEIDALILKYKERAQLFLEKAKNELPYNAEVQNNYTWNEYYLAKYNHKYDVSVKAAEENLEVVKKLYEDGYATRAQYAEAARVWGWNYCEYGHIIVQYTKESDSSGRDKPAAEQTREMLKKVLSLSNVYLYKGQDEKGLIDGWSVYGRANYLLARSYEHPLTLFDGGSFSDTVPPLSGNAAIHFSEQEKALDKIEELGDVTGETSRRRAWVYCRRGNFADGLKTFGQVLDKGVVKYYDDTLKGLVACYYLSIVSTRVAIPAPEKERNLKSMFNVLDKYALVQKDQIAVNQLKKGTCQLAKKMGYNEVPGYCKDLLKSD